MKSTFLVAGLIGLCTTAAFAQKGELKNAQDAITKYQAFKTLGTANILPTLMDGKKAIDKASTNDKTATLAQTYALKSDIYAILTLKDSVNSQTYYPVAEEALKKAKDADTKGEFKSNTDEATEYLGQFNELEGVKQYKAAKYDAAYTAFDKYRALMPEDTNAVYFTGLAAYNAKNYDAALANFNKLATMKYSNGGNTYNNLINIYLMKKDTAAALKAVSEGVAKYPNNGDLRERQIVFFINTGHSKEAVDLIQGAIANDPKNKQLYYMGGVTYTKMGDVLASQQKKLKDQASKDKIETEKLDDYAKSADLYKKAIEIDPNFFEAQYNLGLMLMKPAIDILADAENLPASKQKEYDAAVARAATMVDAAKAPIEKAIALEPKSIDALTNLKVFYLIKKDKTNADATQAKINAMKQ